MEKELNIVEILKNKPEGISLYSSVFGGCVYRGNCDNCIEVVTNNCYYFNEKGHYITNGVKSENGECLLFPSNEMRDWSKFAWKKGDVLVSEGMGRLHVIFEGFDDDTYLTFKGKHYLCNEEEYNGYHKEIILRTIEFKKDNVNDAKAYINTIDEHLGGKFNLETLEIEKLPEFKDGDVVFVRLKRFCFIEIFNYFKDDNLYDHASLSTTLQTIDICGKYPISKDEIVEIRLATDSEKQQLFEALAKEGKVWDVESKSIVDLKPKIELKPFDMVLVRNRNTQRWDEDLFGYKSIFYHCVGGSWNFCIPYIGNESLLGTTKDAEK